MGCSPGIQWHSGMEQVKSLTDYFSDELRELRCQEEIRAYIVSIFSQYQFTEKDLSGRSLTIEYSIAKGENDFARYQNIGDYVFFANSLYPESLNGASKDYYHSVGRMSYYACYRLMNRQWKIYEQLADCFVELSEETRHIIRKPQSS